MFWPDAEPIPQTNPIWRILSLAPAAPSFESGQLLVQKSRAWTAINTASYLTSHGDFYYRHLRGDRCASKDYGRRPCACFNGSQRSVRESVMRQNPRGTAERCRGVGRQVEKIEWRNGPDRSVRRNKKRQALSWGKDCLQESLFQRESHRVMGHGCTPWWRSMLTGEPTSLLAIRHKPPSPAPY